MVNVYVIVEIIGVEMFELKDSDDVNVNVNGLIGIVKVGEYFCG